MFKDPGQLGSLDVLAGVTESVLASPYGFSSIMELIDFLRAGMEFFRQVTVTLVWGKRQQSCSMYGVLFEEEILFLIFVEFLSLIRLE